MTGAPELVASLREGVRRSPALPLLLVAVGVLVWLAAEQGGFEATTWYPAALIVLGLLLVGLLAVPAAGLPRPVVLAMMAFGAYAGWSYLSIAWAAQKGDAWDGANRTALYALVFALFALWGVRGRAAATLLGAYVFAIAVVGGIELLRAASASDPSPYLISGRFASPIGYQNADVALWFSAFWPALALASQRSLAPLLRGAFAVAAVTLGALAVMGQSRGWLFTAPIASVVYLLCGPRRVRAALLLGLAVVALAAVSSPLLHVYDASRTLALPAAVAAAARAALTAALAVGVLVTLAAVLDRRLRFSPARRLRGRAAPLAAALAAATCALAAYAVVDGSPVRAVDRAWHDFKTKQATPYGGTPRLGQSLGSNRYDFWRVAVERFVQRPLVGIGADNFQQAYLAARRSGEEPRYPHSIELRTLSQTGIVGGIILFGGFSSALVAAASAIRARPYLGGAAAAGAALLFTNWLLHGSVDWFWEFPALGGAAFAMLGLASGLMPRPVPAASRLPLVRGSWRAGVLALAIILSASLTAPWLAARQVQRATSSWTRDPGGAYDQLAMAGELNPLSARAQLVAGSIALRLGQPHQAERSFRAALVRDPADDYAHLELGSLLSRDRARRAQASRLLEQAARLDPRDTITAGALARVRAGGSVDLASINRRLAERSLARSR